MVWRQALAAVFAVGLGVVLVLAPQALVRVHLVGRVPNGRGGSYGEDSSLASHWQWVIRALGVGCIGLGLFFATQALG